MQVFLPYPDFRKSLECLDKRRLGKQRVEAFQLINVIESKDNTKAWYNHPAARMFRRNIDALKHYYNLSLETFRKRGGNNIKLKPIGFDTNYLFPNWFGDFNFHRSHRSNLLRKDKVYYGRFGWSEPDDLSYIWPV